MNKQLLKLTFVIFLGLVGITPVFAAVKAVRWTGAEDKNADFSHIVDVVNQKAGLSLKPTDFKPIEDRPLTKERFQMFAQIAAGIPIQSQSIRIWTDLANHDTVQVEAYVDAPPAIAQLPLDQTLSSEDTMQLVRNVVAQHSEDPFIQDVKWKDVWKDKALQRVVKVKGKRGTHEISLSLSHHAVSNYQYQEFPQSDSTTFDIPVQIYPIYEEVGAGDGLLPRIPSQLRGIHASAHRTLTDPFASLRNRHYFDNQMDPVLGVTESGKARGFWAMSVLKSLATQLISELPSVDNTFSSGNVMLDGRYATVSLYPNVKTAFHGLNFDPAISAEFMPDWQPVANNPTLNEMIPSAALLGRPLKSAAEALNRPVRRLANHDPVSYINDGFDELQVYWAVNQMFESLHSMGWQDPELSTRRFNAFLYDPDISYRDNAFYTDDTINFTTYSPKNRNFARDNTTIWHELGHGVMDRLMGDEIQLADTGGLSEGMADFVAQLVINDVQKGQDFPGRYLMRIFNHTGFNLTNEVHDDGEAYGGTMNDLLLNSMKMYGQEGLVKVTDLTLETMRLSRNHPHLTANDWFNHMLFADELGSDTIRRPGELRPLIVAALAGRNFNLGGETPASFRLANGAVEITAVSAGSRSRPIRVSLRETETSTYHLTASLKNSATYSFKFPVTIKVALNGGPLQGAIHWAGKEHSPLTYTLKSENDVVDINLSASGKCDAINRPDGTCVDYAYVQVWNEGEAKKPQAKKRFYLQIAKKS